MSDMHRNAAHVGWRALMPAAPLRPCPVARCPRFRPCPEHPRQVRPEQPSATRRGYSSQWRAYRAEFLARPENRTCVCGCGRTHDGSGTDFVIDHAKAVTGPHDPLFWDPRNHRAMYRGCHSRKTVEHDGAYGRPKRPLAVPV